MRRSPQSPAGFKSAFYRAPFAATSALFLALIPQPSFAQDEAGSIALTSDEPQIAARKPPRNRLIEEITVTAQKREQSLSDVPMSISALSGEMLEELGAESLQDISRSTPSFSVVEASPGVQNMQIRGIAVNFGKSTVGYQMDNVSLTSNALFQPSAAVYDLDSVEILRGPQGTLYGEGSMGGTVKLVTRKPEYALWDGSAQFGYNMTADGTPGWEIDSALNIPVTDDSAFRLVWSSDRIGGYIDQVELGIPNENTAKINNGRVHFGWAPSDNWEIQALIMNSNVFAEATNAGDEHYQRDEEVDGYTDDEGQMYSLDLNWASSFGDWSFTNTYFDRALYLTYDARQAVENFAPTGIAILDATVAENSGRSRGLYENVVKTLASELRYVGNPLPELFVTAGLFWRDNEDQFRGYIDVAGGAETGAPPFQDYTGINLSDQRSVFTQLEYDVLGWLNLAAGARLFEETIDFVYTGHTGYTGSADSEDSASFDNFSKRLVASFRGPEQWGPVDHLLGYLSYSEGYRSGGVNVRVTTGGVDTATFPVVYQPDTLGTLEAGGKLAFLNNLLSVELAVFFNEWEDIQLVTNNGDFNYFDNVGDAEGLGVEWNFTYAPVTGLLFSLAGSYIDTKYVTGSLSKNVGDPIDYVPPLQYALSASYRFDWAPGRPGSARLDYSHTDKTLYGDRGRGLLFESDTLRLLNARLGFELARQQFYLYGRNLTDTRGATDANAVVGLQARQRPRQLGLEVKWQF